MASSEPTVPATRRLAEDDAKAKVVPTVHTDGTLQATAIQTLQSDPSKWQRPNDLSCSKCFRAAPENTYCMLGQDVYQGFCCDADLDAITGCKTTTAGSSFCSTSADASSQKYAFCPFDEFKCGNQQRKIVSQFRQQSFLTTLEFQDTDICSYILTSETNFQIDTSIQLKVTSLQDASLVILSGQSMSSLNKTTKITRTGSTELLAIDQLHVLVALPLIFDAAKPLVGFEVQNKSATTLLEFGLKYGQYMVGVVLLVCAFGLCSGNAVISGELEDLEPPSMREYTSHLKSYVQTGNVWDPEEEAALRARLGVGAGAEGGAAELFHDEAPLPARQFTKAGADDDVLPAREFAESYYSRRDDEMRRTGFSSCTDCRSHAFSESRYSDRTRSRYAGRDDRRDYRRDDFKDDRRDKHDSYDGGGRHPYDAPREAGPVHDVYGLEPPAPGTILQPAGLAPANRWAAIDLEKRRAQNRNPLAYAHGRQWANVEPMELAKGDKE